MKVEVIMTKVERKVLNMVKKIIVKKQVTQLFHMECHQNQKSLFCSYFFGKHFIKFLIMECLFC